MQLTYGNAIKEALDHELDTDNSVVFFGQDIQHDVYGYTGGLYLKYGGNRIRNTPISESAIIGTAIGAAICGLKTVVDLTVGNFLYVAMDQIANIAAKNSYMYNGQYDLPVTIMYGTFQNTRSASQHSDRPHPLLMNIPGLKVVAPASPQDAYGLLRSSIRDLNPVIYFTDRSLFYESENVDFNSLGGLGEGKILKNGDDLTIISISGCKTLATDVIPTLNEKGISAEIIDVRSLVPLDKELIIKSVTKTGRAIILDTANRTCSAASEIASILVESAFNKLKAPIGILTYDNVPVPFAKNLENHIMPTKEKLLDKIFDIMS